MGAKTLKEVCELINVTRRTVQGYEKAGLVTSIGRNKYGYLLYDENEIQKIRMVKKYQSFGFSIKEIRDLQDLPKQEYLEILENRLILMKRELQCMKENISTLEKLILKERY